MRRETAVPMSPAAGSSWAWTVPGWGLDTLVLVLPGPLVPCVDPPWTWGFHLLSRVAFPALLAVLGAWELRDRGHGSLGGDSPVLSSAGPFLVSSSGTRGIGLPCPSSWDPGSERRGPVLMVRCGTHGILLLSKEIEALFSGPGLQSSLDCRLCGS